MTVYMHIEVWAFEDICIGAFGQLRINIYFKKSMNLSLLKLFQDSSWATSWGEQDSKKPHPNGFFFSRKL